MPALQAVLVTDRHKDVSFLFVDFTALFFVFLFFFCNEHAFCLKCASQVDAIYIPTAEITLIHLIGYDCSNLAAETLTLFYVFVWW